MTMSRKQMAPYGSWKSPITADLVSTGAVRLSQIWLDGEEIYWCETRPVEGGRTALVRRRADGVIEDATPADFNVRSRVHEYGGGAALVHQGTLFFVHFADQRLYRQDPGGTPHPLTPAADLRYADMVADPGRDRLISVREEHTADGRVINTLVALDLIQGGAGERLVAGSDFYAAPRLSPDGQSLAWLSWNHPNMPWDGCELWTAPVAEDGSLGTAQLVAGGVEESICQPTWSPSGELTFISDRSGWWNLYRQRAGQVEPLLLQEAEMGTPQWVFGLSTYAFTTPQQIVCALCRRGEWVLASLETTTGRCKEFDTPFTVIGFLCGRPGEVIFLGAGPTHFPAVIRLDLASGAWQELRSANRLPVAQGYLSLPEAIEFPTAGGLTAHGFYYAPQNQDYQAPAGAKPPLLVFSHGGPTSATHGNLDLAIQYWTSRGIAVVDVNYGGSSGYGRAYRRRLNGQWGVVDLEDCVHAARTLASRAWVDEARVAIRGGSAGGYTTLCALTFSDFFQAGASYYGISDLEALAQETHKFESRYLDRLIGPYPERRDLYRARSPIHFVHRLSCPIIFFQGLEDKVVLPNQAERMVDALRAKGLPVAYLPFPGEQHGFRRAENIRRALEAEFTFYGRIFGFTPADPVEPLAIDNL